MRFLCHILLVLLLTTLTRSFQPPAPNEANQMMLTKALFEATFKELPGSNQNDSLQLNPNFAQVFAAIGATTREGKVVRRLTSACWVNLLKDGQGVINERCSKMIAKFGPTKRQSDLTLVYRCFRNTSHIADPTDYQLHSTAIDAVTQERRDAFILHFTPVPAGDCRPKYFEELSYERMVHSLLKWHIELLADQMRATNAEPLTKEAYEAAFRGLLDYFFLNPQVSYVFRRKKGERQLTPVRQCFVEMYEGGKGVVVESCVETLDMMFRIDQEMISFLIPYRCYLHNEGDDHYELHNTTISGFGRDKTGPGGRYIIMFTLPKHSHCSPRLAVMSSEWAQTGLTLADAY